MTCKEKGFELVTRLIKNSRREVINILQAQREDRPRRLAVWGTRLELGEFGTDDSLQSLGDKLPKATASHIHKGCEPPWQMKVVIGMRFILKVSLS
jgi:hypothetical protein